MLSPSLFSICKWSTIKKRKEKIPCNKKACRLLTNGGFHTCSWEGWKVSSNSAPRLCHWKHKSNLALVQHQIFLLLISNFLLLTTQEVINRKKPTLMFPSNYATPSWSFSWILKFKCKKTKSTISEQAGLLICAIKSCLFQSNSGTAKRVGLIMLGAFPVITDLEPPQCGLLLKNKQLSPYAYRKGK